MTPLDRAVSLPFRVRYIIVTALRLSGYRSSSPLRSPVCDLAAYLTLARAGFKRSQGFCCRRQALSPLPPRSLPRTSEFARLTCGVFGGRCVRRLRICSRSVGIAIRDVLSVRWGRTQTTDNSLNALNILTVPATGRRTSLWSLAVSLIHTLAACRHHPRRHIVPCGCCWHRYRRASRGRISDRLSAAWRGWHHNAHRLPLAWRVTRGKATGPATPTPHGGNAAERIGAYPLANTGLNIPTYPIVTPTISSSAPMADRPPPSLLLRRDLEIGDPVSTYTL